MLRRCAALALAFGSLGASVRAEGEAFGETSRLRIEETIARVRPALVRLTVVTQQYADGRALRFPSSGSGVIVSERGHVLTNFHVAGRSVRLRATLADGEEVPAEVVAHDPLTDLSVLRLIADRSFTPLDFAEGEAAVGTPVLALGNPLSLASTVTLGIVSNARRVFTDFTASRLEEFDLDGEPTGLYTLWLQHDALILPGNSGGPLVDLDGRIVGINELGGGGIGFAIPAAMARRVLDEILAHGRVRRADLGIAVLPAVKAGREEGALVSSVDEGSPAALAGVAPGDFLVAIDGSEVSARQFEEVPELYRRIAELEIGAAVELELERRGERLRVTLNSQELDSGPGREAEVRPLGAAVQELSRSMARARQLPTGAGLVVTSLRAGSAAALARPAVQVGDLISAVGGSPVRTIAALSLALAEADGGEVLLELRRDDERLLAVARLGDERTARSVGELPKAWLGITTQVMTGALSAAVGRPELRGFRVTRVMPWSEAEQAGLAVGDVIVAVDGSTLAAEREQDAENLRRVVEEREIGDRIELAVERDGGRRAVVVRLEARPKGPAEARTARQEALGFAVRELTQFDRVEFHWPREQRGVLVTEIAPGGWAQMAGLEPNDLVVALSGSEVVDLGSFERAASAAAAARRPVVEIFVRRGWRTHFVFLEPSWNGEGIVGEENR